MDYEGIAFMLRQHIIGATSSCERDAAVAITGNLSGFFAESDRTFDEGGFLADCGYWQATGQGYRQSLRVYDYRYPDNT